MGQTFPVARDEPVVTESAKQAAMPQFQLGGPRLGILVVSPTSRYSRNALRTSATTCRQSGSVTLGRQLHQSQRYDIEDSGPVATKTTAIIGGGGRRS
jgi:hypothetical protein